MDKITEEIVEQIAEIRTTGRTNMFARGDVQIIANQLEFYELVCWIEDNRKYYMELLEMSSK